jgi:hypothetical protein
LLKSVDLTEFAYPCITFIIKRCGLSLSIKEILETPIEKYETFTKLAIGDILIWDNVTPPEPDLMTLIFDSTVGVITSSVDLSKHFGVYEGNGLVSDVVHDSNTYYPHIRVMTIDDHSNMPSSYIKLKTLRRKEK